MRTANIDSAERARPPRWHVIYGLLALLMVMVVGLTLVLIHRIVGSYGNSVGLDERWEEVHTSSVALGDAADGLRSPAARAFTATDVEFERTRLETAVGTFHSAAARLRTELDALAAGDSGVLVLSVDAVERAGDAMAATSRQVLGLVGTGSSAEALTVLARIDDDHARLDAALGSTQRLVANSRRVSFDRQLQDIEGLQWFEYVVAGILLLVVLAATYYGARLRQELDRHAAEREAHVRQLELTEAELREARDVLEDRVRERTRELADANEALRDEINERRRAETELRLSEERYALAAHSANDGLWDWDLKADHFYSSPRWRSLIGYEPDELSDGSNEWLARVHPDDRGDLEARIRAHLADTNVPLQSEHRVLHRDGSYRWMLVRATAVIDEDGHPTRMVGSHADVTMRKQAELQLIHDALHDTLTGLPNRAMFIDRLDLALRRSRRPDGGLFAVLFIDLDRFKVVNDSLGHVVGDDLLIEVGHRLTSVLRPGDLVARFGGDEFTILVERLSAPAGAIAIAERVLESLAEPIHLDGYDVRASASIGIAVGSKAYESTADILRDSDTAMYRAKSEGRSEFRVFEPAMHDTALDILVLETDLRHAVEREELALVYQPIVSLADGAVTGFEALARWHHPARGVISPATFVAVAEDSGDIVPMGRWVLGQACRQVRTWKRLAGAGDDLYVSVNVSPRELMEPDFVDFVRRLLLDHGLGPRSLRLELTESSVMADREQMVESMQRLARLGVGISIDDFGTGQSTLSYVKDLPIDTLKIDRAFVSELTRGGKDVQLVRTIVELGRSLQLTVVAEGIETGDQAAVLARFGCEFGQGYHYFRPMDPADVGTLLAQAGQGAKITG